MLLRQLFQVKKVRFQPDSVDVVIYGLASTRHVLPLLEKCGVGSYSIFDKYKTIYLVPLFKALVDSLKNGQSVTTTYVEHAFKMFSTRVVITALHNDSDFFHLVEANPKSEFLVIQSGFLVDRRWSMDIDWEWVSSANFENLTVWSWGWYFDYIFLRFRNASVVHVGSTESIRCVSAEKSEPAGQNKRVLLVSQYRPARSSEYQRTINDFQAQLARCVGELAAAQGLNFVVIGSRKKFAERLWEKVYFTKVMKGVHWEWTPRELSSSNLGKSLDSLIGIGIDSSLLFQLAECGIQVAVSPAARPDYDGRPWQDLSEETRLVQLINAESSEDLKGHLQQVLTSATLGNALHTRRKRVAEAGWLILLLERFVKGEGKD